VNTAPNAFLVLELQGLNMKSESAQRGLSFVGWLLALGVLGFLISTAIKVIPHYLDYMSLKKIISSVETDQSSINSVSDFYSRVAKGMQVNSVQGVDLNKALSVTAENHGFVAHLKYEQREPLVENIDLVVKFDHEFSVGKP
jgi:hypothetical protein